MSKTFACKIPSQIISTNKDKRHAILLPSITSYLSQAKFRNKLIWIALTTHVIPRKKTELLSAEYSLYSVSKLLENANE